MFYPPTNKKQSQYPQNNKHKKQNKTKYNPPNLFVSI
jgi:hypothetical protein